MNKKFISVFTPVYNEEENILAIYNAVKTVMTHIGKSYDYEHVFSDNASNDNSLLMLKEICSDDKRVKVISLSKNFGVTKSTLNGLFRCEGEAIIQIDADLQDPPKLIIDFLKKWEEGYSVVYGIRDDRDENWFMKTLRKIFYRVANKLSNENLIPDVGEFRLIDKKILMELKKIEDSNPYLRGIIANIGFDQIGIPYYREKRNSGKTSTNLFTLFDYGINGIISHSTILLRLSTIVGLILSSISFILIILNILLKLILQQSPPGLTSLMIFILFFAGIQMIFLGIIGEYVSKIFIQSISRPLVIEKEIINFETAEN
jgi:polyisoprenyl-phosphate glycosyltransferase